MKASNCQTVGDNKRESGVGIGFHRLLHGLDFTRFVSSVLPMWVKIGKISFFSQKHLAVGTIGV
jgi:hypothetical protein